MSTTWMRMEPIPEPDPREAKLPAWARDQLAKCRRIAAESQRVARDARLSTKPDESDAVLDYHGDVPVGLGRRPEVTFKLPGRNGWERYISVRLDRDGKRLHVMGAEQVSIRPGSGNTVTVELAE